MKLFGTVCGSNAVDCFNAEDATIFVAQTGKTGKAIGKNGANIKKLKSALNTEVKVIETSDSLEKLVSNFLFPIKAKAIQNENSIVKIKFSSSRERRALLNNNQKELKKLKITVSRYYPEIRDIHVMQNE